MSMNTSIHNVKSIKIETTKGEHAVWKTIYVKDDDGNRYELTLFAKDDDFIKYISKSLLNLSLRIYYSR